MVSIIIITHGREELLSKCLTGLAPVAAKAELILVANGRPLSSALTESARKTFQRVDVIDLPEKELPGKARNMGLSRASNEWIYFIDDDAYWPPGYAAILLPLLEDPKIEVLGGPDSPAHDMGYVATSLGIALSSPLCTGGTFARHRSLGRKLIRAQEDKLTSCNLWVRKSVLGDCRFPEDYRRTEENQFLQILMRQNALMYYHPLLRVAHYRRNSLREMLIPGFNTGVYRSRLMREKVTAPEPVFWLPSVFVLLHLTIFLDPPLFLYFAKIYLGVVVLVSIGLASQRGKFFHFPMVAFLHYYIVFLFGLGFLFERMRRWI